MAERDILVPKARYTSSDFARREWERMWKRVWLIAGWEGDVRAPGSYLTYDIGPESILVTRGDDGLLRAFHNVCLHRGNRLRHHRVGHAESFVCGYHGWDWGRDGALRVIVDPESFPRGVPPACRRLRDVRCEAWGGFVWIALGDDAPPLAEYLGRLRDVLAPYRPEAHTLTRDVTLEIACNWKALIDNGNETYHLHRVHPELLDLVDDYDVGPELLGRHSRFRVRFGSPSRRCDDREAIGPSLEGILRKAGLAPEPFAGKIEQARGALIGAMQARLQRDGIDFPDLAPEQLVDNEHVHVFPNAMFNVIVPGFWLFRARPHPTDPGRMFFDFQEYERLPAGAGSVARPEHQSALAGEIAIDSVLDQDTRILPSVQDGMRSMGFEHLILGEQEGRIRHMHDVLGSYCDD